MPAIQPITACWAVVTTSLAWFTWDTYHVVMTMHYQDIPAWQQTLTEYVFATLIALVLTYMTAVASQRWAGAILVVASLALGAIPVVMALVLAGCHGCGDVMGFGTAVVFLLYAPIAVYSFIVGVRQAGRPTTSDNDR